jgi:hypothetical protein
VDNRLTAVDFNTTVEDEGVLSMLRESLNELLSRSEGRK